MVSTVTAIESDLESSQFSYAALSKQFSVSLLIDLILGASRSSQTNLERKLRIPCSHDTELHPKLSLLTAFESCAVAVNLIDVRENRFPVSFSSFAACTVSIHEP